LTGIYGQAFLLPANPLNLMKEYSKMVEKLPADNQVLVIINCSKSADEVIENRAYLCPAEGTAYQHKPVRYFGVYKNRTVLRIANIEAVVRVNTDLSTEFYYVAGGAGESIYQERAIKLAKDLRFSRENPPTDVKVFILGYMNETNIKKATPGGMQGSKQYEDMGEYNVDSAGLLASKLYNKTWPKN
jgi:hypothetical protein